MMLESILPNNTVYKGPALIYDLQAIKKRMNFFLEISSETNVKFLFTVKSFPFKEIIEISASNMSGFEVSNLNECQLLPQSLSGAHISINDPSLQFNFNIPKELYENNYCYINLDIPSTEKDRLPIHQNIAYGLRVSHTSIIDSAKSEIPRSRFGINLNELHQFKGLFHQKTIKGIHLHNGSEENTLDTYVEMLDNILSLLKKENISISFLNLGGGLHNMTIDEITQLVHVVTQRTLQENIYCFFEPGQAITRQAGYAIAKVMAIKHIGNNEFVVILDISNELHLKWSSPILKPQKHSDCIQSKKATITFAGPTCYEHDCIGTFEVSVDNHATPFRIGDIVCFTNVNGYSAAWNTGFNGIAPAQVSFVTHANFFNEAL